MGKSKLYIDGATMAKSNEVELISNIKCKQFNQ